MRSDSGGSGSSAACNPQGLLHFDRPAHGIEGTGKLGQNAVARRLHDLAAMKRRLRADDVGKDGHPALVGARLVAPHQDRIADDVDKGDGREPPLHARLLIAVRWTTYHLGSEPRADHYVISSMKYQVSRLPFSIMLRRHFKVSFDARRLSCADSIRGATSNDARRQSDIMWYCGPTTRPGKPTAKRNLKRIKNIITEAALWQEFCIRRSKCRARPSNDDFLRRSTRDDNVEKLDRLVVALDITRATATSPAGIVVNEF